MDIEAYANRGARWKRVRQAYLIDINDVVVNVRSCPEARTTLVDITEHIPEGELRASFVGLPEVRAILTG